MGTEYERKFTASPQQLSAVAQLLGELSPVTMETVYYDTRERSLSARRITLRRRLENGKSICTLKTPAADGARGEWELACHSIHAAVPELCKLGAPAELTQWTASGLQAVCGARFTRLTKTLSLPDCTLEVALDQGVLLGGSRELPLCELEVELKDGSRQTCDRWAAALAQRFGLTEEKTSKFRRALALAEGEDHGI